MYFVSLSFHSSCSRRRGFCDLLRLRWPEMARASVKLHKESVCVCFLSSLAISSRKCLFFPFVAHLTLFFLCSFSTCSLSCWVWFFLLILLFCFQLISQKEFLLYLSVCFCFCINFSLVNYRHPPVVHHRRLGCPRSTG